MEGSVWKEVYGRRCMEGSVWKEVYGRKCMEGYIGPAGMVGN